MYDLRIDNGTLVDGTGAPRYVGSIAVKDGRIVEVGEVSGRAKRTIDAEGAVVTPGFTDIHTHYDGQISWDEEMAPSSQHGVTTCVLGSCGVGFAPVRPKDRERLIELMEGVEDIPGTALYEGLRWDWESFPEYMEAIDRIPHTVDFLAQVPHDALRVYVMGERAVANGDATEADIEAMRTLARQALEAGACGFSTGRTDNHRTKHGDHTPASDAAGAELEGIARAFAGLGHGVLQAVSDFDMTESDDRFDAEFDLLERMARASDGHRLSISLLQRDQSPKQWEWITRRAEKATAAGHVIRLQTAARAIGVMLGLDATFHPFMGFPSYKSISNLPLAERVAKMRDPDFKRVLLTETSERVSGDGSSIPPLADQLLAQIDLIAMRLYRLGENPNYEPPPSDCVYYQAQLSNQPVLAAVYDALLEQDGKALLYFPLYNYTEMNLNVVKRMLSHPLALPGLGDGGAHVGTVCDASFPTFLLSHWGRSEEDGGLGLERVVKMQTHDTSRFIGLEDRGTIAPGQKADLNVIDFDQLGLRPPEMHADLPGGGKRLLQGATGYRATLVGGVSITEDGEFTGERPGHLVRAGR
ncbi:MAG: amidohydrolase family protein [Myxococcota bacterium]